MRNRWSPDMTQAERKAWHADLDRALADQKRAKEKQVTTKLEKAIRKLTKGR